MAFPFPPPYTNPIPNNPFYWPQEWVIDGPYGPLVVGSGLYVSATGTLISTGGGPGVAQILAGPGISVDTPTGIVTITNTGVLSLLAGAGISLNAATGNVTISAAAAGTVTAVGTGVGLTGGPITTSGQIDLANSGVAAGTYSNPTITVDVKGRIITALNGTSVQSVSGTAPISVTGTTTPVVSVSNATTGAPGVVQLSTSVSSTSTTQAATPSAVKTAYDAAILAIPKTCLPAKGALVAGAGASLPVALPVGTDGQALLANSAAPSGLSWTTITQCTGTVTQVDAGFGLTGGSITTSGILSLDPAAVIEPSDYLAKGSILAATAFSTPVNLPVGADGTVLMANSTNFQGVQWTAITQCLGTVTQVGTGLGILGGPITGTGTVSLDFACVIPPTAFLNKGDLLTATAAATPVALPVGADGRVLMADSLSAEGMVWSPITQCLGTVTQVDAGVGLLGGSITTTGTLTLDPACVIPPPVMTAKGDVLTATGPSAPTALPVGVDGQYLSACALCPTGLTWITPPVYPLTLPNYGSFSSSFTQVNILPTSYNTVAYDTTSSANNFSITAGTRVTAAAAGIYGIDVSLQVVKTDTGTDIFEYWLAKNGVDIPGTTRTIKMHSNDSSVIATLGWIESLNIGDYVEIRWYSQDFVMQLAAIPAVAAVPGVNPARPLNPSAIITISQIGG